MAPVPGEHPLRPSGGTRAATMVTLSGGEAKGSELDPKEIDRQCLSQRNPSEVDGARAGRHLIRVPQHHARCHPPGDTQLAWFLREL